MPALINTPEDWFRTQQRDLYIIEYRYPDEDNEGTPEAIKRSLKKINQYSIKHRKR